MKFLVIKTSGDIPEVVETKTDFLRFCYEKIGCDYVDARTCVIEGKKYDLWVDDEGLLKENPIPSCFDGESPCLVGNIVVAKSNKEGETLGLTDEDICVLLRNVKIAVSKDGAPVCVLAVPKGGI